MVDIKICQQNISEDDVVDSTKSCYIPGIHLCICKAVNSLFVYTVVTLFIYTRMLLSLQKCFFDLVYTNHGGFYTAKNLLPITKNTKNQ